MQRNYDYVFKVCLMGQSAVGKTALLRRYADDEFEENMLPTIGVDFRFKSINVKGDFVKLQLWDTAGQERFRSVVEGYYRDADAIIMVYDGLNLQSFHTLDDYWLGEVKRQTKAGCLVYAMANKMEDKGRISREQKEWCDKQSIKCFEVSAKTGQGVSEAIRQIVGKLAQSRPRIERDKVVMTLNEYNPKPKKGCCK